MVLVVLFACGDMRQDELDCEEAVSHLQSCCPGFDSSGIQCIYVAGCEDSTLPDISIQQSQCIRGEDCSRLVTTAVCTRAQGVWPVMTDGTLGATSAETVCP
jgi:hypothetical protein